METDAILIVVAILLNTLILHHLSFILSVWNIKDNSIDIQ